MWLPREESIVEIRSLSELSIDERRCSSELSSVLMRSVRVASIRA